MRKNEFNDNQVNNGKNNASFSEFGYRQSHEFTSYKANKNTNKCEINDNYAQNAYRKKDEQMRHQEENKRQFSSDNSSKGKMTSSGVSTSGSVAATVVGTVVVSVTTISVLVGINAYVWAKVKMNDLSLTPVELIYNLDITDTFDDDYVIKLENEDFAYDSYQELIEGNNEGSFEDLIPDTEYNLSIINQTRDNYPVYKEVVTTLSRNVVTYEVRFYIDDDYTVQNVEENGYVTRPEDPKKVGYIFKGWSTNPDTYTPYDFDTPVTSNLNLYASFVLDEPGIYGITWDKSYSASTGEMEYSINYRDDGSLSNFALTLTSEESPTGGPSEETYQLNIAEGTQTVILNLQTMSFDETYDYSFTYSRNRENNIVVETGKVKFTNSDPSISNFAFTNFVIDNDFFTADYSYTTSGKEEKFVDKDFSIKFIYSDDEELVSCSLDIDPALTSGSLTSDTPFFSEFFTYVYDYEIYISGSNDPIYSGSVAPYFRQKNKFMGLVIGGFDGDGFYYDNDGEIYIPVYVVLDSQTVDYSASSASFVYKVENDDTLYESPTPITLADAEHPNGLNRSWLIEVDSSIVDDSLISFTYVGIKYNNDIIFEQYYDEYSLPLFSIANDDDFNPFGAVIDSYVLDRSEPTINLYMLSNHNVSNITDMSIRLYYMTTRYNFDYSSDTLLYSSSISTRTVVDDTNLISFPLYYTENEGVHIPEEIIDIIEHDSHPLDIVIAASFYDSDMPWTREFTIMKNITFTFAD